METGEQITSFSQSLRLLDAGIRGETSDCTIITQYHPIMDVFAWTLDGLIDLLPKEIKFMGKTLKLSIKKRIVEYVSSDKKVYKSYSEHDNLIDNLTDAVIRNCWEKAESQITTIEQSRRLLKAGIKPLTSCVWAENVLWSKEAVPDLDNNVPAWTMGELINMLPERIKDESTGEFAYLLICKGGVFYDKTDECGLYVNIRKWPVDMHKWNSHLLIDSIVDAICDLCGNKNNK